MKFRRFTSAGIAAVRDYLAKCKAVSALDIPARDALLANESFSESIAELADLDFDPTRTFDTTFAFCEYLHSLIKDRKPLTYRTDVGFWTYLAMAYLEQLVKVDRRTGVVNCGDESRVIYEAYIFGKSHRHLLASAYYIYRQHAGDPELTKTPLFHSIDAPGDIHEGVMARQEISQNPAFLKAIHDLYFVAGEGRLKRKIAGPNRPGGIRRFFQVVDQIGMTRDFYEKADAAEFIALLPAEFNPFKG